MESSEGSNQSLEPLTLQNLVSEEEMAKVEMTFATERGQRKPAPMVDLEEHAEAGSELPFVGKSSNKNAEPLKAKVRIIRNDYSELLQEAQNELEPAREEPAELEMEPIQEETPKRSFRKLKIEDAPEPTAEETIEVSEDLPPAKEPANTPYRKLKAN